MISTTLPRPRKIHPSPLSLSSSSSLPSPSYKEHLKNMIERTNNNFRKVEKDIDKEEDTIIIASPEATIVSSVHSLNLLGVEYEQQQQGQVHKQQDAHDDSFLSVSPSMLDSSIFEVTPPPSSSSSSSSLTSPLPPLLSPVSLEENDQTERHNNNINNNDNDNNKDESYWHDRSTFEMIGSRMFDEDDESVTTDSNNNISTNGECESGNGSKGGEKKVSLKSKNTHEANSTTTGLGAALEVGTMVAGIFGIVLIVATSIFSDNTSVIRKKRKHQLPQ